MTATASKLYSLVCWVFYLAASIKTLHMGGLLFGWSLLSYDGDLWVSLAVAVLSPLFGGGHHISGKNAHPQMAEHGPPFLNRVTEINLTNLRLQA